MCGIAGIVRFDGMTPSHELVKRMANEAAHRGPDGEGVFTAPGVAFAHKRLAIIDLATGQQPMTVGPFTIVFNGEIYNYVELRESLRRRGVAFRTTSDTEVLLRMYEVHGADFVNQLNGMFAFVLFDHVRGTVLAGRDHFGIKPLYYVAIPDQLVFASEIKSLLVHPAVRREANECALREYLTFQYTLGDHTLFQGVRKLLPGHRMEIDLHTGHRSITRYWAPEFGCDLHHTDEYFQERTRELLNDAVRMQLRSDVPVGAYLSGGLDSSIVTALAAQHGTVRAFTAKFPVGPAFDESAYARDVASSLGITLDEVIPTEREFVDVLPKLVWHMDEPAAGPGLFPQYVVSRLASQHVKVVLGGQGGDEVFGGYVRYMVAYLEQALRGAIFETNDEGKHIVSLQSILPNLPALRQYVPMLRSFWSDGLFESMDRRYFKLIDRSGGTDGMLSSDFTAGFDTESVFERFAASFNAPRTASYLARMTHFDLMHSLPALLQVEDRVSMAHGLESRVPLLDHRLVDLVATMPARARFDGGELKHLLKRAAGDVIPPSVLHRKDKMGFPVPLHEWVRGYSREFVNDILLSRQAVTRGVFAPAAVEGLLRTEPPFSRRIWGMLNLELWYRTFIDQSSPTPVGATDEARCLQPELS